MKYAFLGAGKMALALIHGMLRAKLCGTSDILVASRSKTNLENFVNASSVQGAATNFEAADEADVVVLCVKPADALKALEEAGDGLEGKLLVSVVTGLKIETLRDAAPESRIVRAMPNTAAMVGKSATALAFEKTVSKKDQQVAEKIFQAVGTVFPVAENLLDAVTGLSGSGPAFVYLMMEALSDGGVEAGLSRKLALDLAIQTVMGAAEMASATAEHPAVLREMVTSPGGTTIAGLSVLEQAAVRSAFSRAVKAASERSKQLSNG
jgi:pyrroline-5-carboxylate reductase